MLDIVQITKRIERIIEEKKKERKEKATTTPSPTSWNDGLNGDRGKKAPFCPICKDELFIIDPENPWKAIACECRNQQILNKRLKGSLIPDEFEHATFENFVIEHEHQKKMFDAVQEYLEKFDEIRHTPHNSLALLAKLGESEWKRKYGSNYLPPDKNSYGVGKTHLTMALAKELMKRGYSVKCISDMEFMDQLSMARFFNDGGVEFQSLLDSVIQPDVLVWDDLGKSKVSEANHRYYYRIINQRYNSHKPIIFSSNESAETLIEKIDYRAWSRLIGMCGKYIVPVAGPDYRLNPIPS